MEKAQTMNDDMIKLAAEYDSAGRIMARGFYDEFQKLAACGPKMGTGSGEQPPKKNGKAPKKNGKNSPGAVHMFMQD